MSDSYYQKQEMQPLIESDDDLFEVESEGVEDEVIEQVENPLFDLNQINIITKQDTLINIIERMRFDEINLRPPYQRNINLWNPKQQSRLIESILIRIPLPAFYFDCTGDGRWEVIDGLQRLSAIRNFVLEKDNKLTLTGLEYLKNLHGKKYDDLDRQNRRRINECPITYFQIIPGTAEDIKFSIFRRINTGGLTLNEQEMRNALASDTARNFLQKLSNSKYFLKVTSCTDNLKKRMKDHELILRFLSFYHLDVKSRPFTNISELLNSMMSELNRSSDEQRQEWEDAFNRGMQRSFLLFGETAFQRSQTRRVRKNTPLYEVWSVILSRLTDAEWACIIPHRVEILSRHQVCLQEPGYDRSLSVATQKKEHINIRYGTVQKILGSYVEFNKNW